MNPPQSSQPNNWHEPYIEPYQVPDPFEDLGDDDAGPGPMIGHAEAITEYSASFMQSLEYKQMRAAAKHRGKLGF